MKLIIIIFIILNTLPTIGMGQAAAPAAATGAMDKVKSLTGNSMGILVMSVIGTVYSGILYSGAAKQVEESEANIKKIDLLIKTFKDSFANFCPNGREVLTEPKCYCYLENGAQNTNRTKSQTCIDLWAKDTYNLAINAGDYSGVATAVNPVGCVNLNGQFDEKCACRKFIDVKGGNACMKTTNISIPSGLGSGFATNSGLRDVTNFSNSSANGKSNLGLITTAQLKTSAINARKLSDQLISKLGSSLPLNAQNLLKVDGKNIGQLTASVFGAKGIPSGGQGSTSAVGIASSRPVDPNLNSLLDAAAQKAGLTEVTGSGRGLAKKADGKDMSFNFMGDPSAANTQTQNFPETQKNYNYKNSDISKNMDSSIFEIISNRYIQSGLKRLFEN